MARLPYVAPDGDVTDRIKQRRGGKLTALDGVLLHSPPLADGWNSMLGAVRGASTLPADIRELAILRVASRNGADYEWAAHEPLARQAGLGDEAIRSVSAGTPGADGAPGAGGLSPAQWAALAYADAMTVHVAVPDEVFDVVRAHFSEREVLELTVTVASYNMVSRVLVAMGVRAGEDPFGARVLRSLSWLTVCFSCARSRVPFPRPSSPTGTTTSTSPPG
jgi:4-carboxymuconolactone decarboxylase